MVKCLPDQASIHLENLYYWSPKHEWIVLVYIFSQLTVHDGALSQYKDGWKWAQKKTQDFPLPELQNKRKSVGKTKGEKFSVLLTCRHA